MIYINSDGELVDTDKKTVICPCCNEVISKEDIDNGNVYYDGISNPHTGEEWHELLHLKCADETDNERRDKYGY